MKQKWIIAGIGMLLFGITLGIFYLARSSSQEKKAEQVKANSVKVSQEERIQERQKILRFEGETPCEPNMDFVFLLETYGDSVSMSFPGILTPVKYYGKGHLPILEDRTSGSVPIKSLNPHKKKVRITVWEIR